MTRSGALAFGSLQGLLIGDALVDGAELLEEPTFDRFRRALVSNASSALDRVVLLRQVLLYETSRRGGNHPAELRIPSNWGIDGSKSSLRVINADGYKIVRALPWMPEWLAGAERGVDAWAAGESLVRFDNSDVLGDPFLLELGYEKYRSRGQRAAARAVLTTPPGHTLAVVLATGEGKSLLFQLIDAVGFAGDDHTARRGTTLVVVPTVALAVDHTLSTPGSHARAWQAGATGSNAQILDAIRAGTQGLCFASPEAVCGPMRAALLEAVTSGLLRAIVLDEAHMVDAWGTGFRTEFQELSGFHAEAIALSSTTQAPRTICLTATLSESARETLETLFMGRGFKIISAARLRAEPEYWFAHLSVEAERDRRIMEVMCHVPRPAILYVTKVAAAIAWERALRHAGFSRVRAFHGATTFGDREAILNSWRGSELDVVVGTSAFGLGLNNAHVRSVIHACVPETIDRYYQEVGRGGRDGRSYLSIVVPAYADNNVATSINRTVTIGLDRGRERWLSMFDGPKLHLGENAFAIRLDIAPGPSAADIDMVGERSTDWNARVITLMARAGLLRLRGKPSMGSETGTWQSVEILNHEHRSVETWEQCIKPLRAQIANANSSSLDLMHELLEQESVCPADVLLRVYRNTTPQCSRCNLCWDGKKKWPILATEVEPLSPWPLTPPSREIAELLDGGRLIVLVDDSGPLALRRLRTVFVQLVNGGMRNILLFGDVSPQLASTVAALNKSVVFVDSEASPSLSTLPIGPELVIVGDSAPLREIHLAPRAVGSERILFVSPRVRSPKRPDLALIAINSVRDMTVRELYGRMQ